MLTIQDIHAATKRVYNFAVPTPTVKNTFLSDLLHMEVYCKLENLQVTNAFKIRGNANAIPLLSKKLKNTGLITTSTGNHGLGFAYIAKALNIDAVVVVPETAPQTKVSAIKKVGAKIITYGNTLSEAYEYAHQIASAENRQFIGSFDNEPFFAGNATIALEILQAVKNVDVIIAPIGGGGLMSGLAFAIKQVKPSVKVYGVQAEGAAAMYRSVQEKKPVQLLSTRTFADGIAVNKPSQLSLNYVTKYVDDIFLVSDTAIKDALSLLFTTSKLIVEGAGAASTAALLTHAQMFKGKRVVVVITGGNIAPLTLCSIVQDKSNHL